MPRATTLSHLTAPAALVALAALTACVDPTSAPTAVAVEPLGSSLFESPPPPPPIDTMAVALDSESSGFAIRVTYFLNQTGNNSWLAFHTTTLGGEVTAEATPSARIKLSGDNTVKSTGALTIPGMDGDDQDRVILLDGATLVQGSNLLGPCDGGGEVPTTEDVVVRPPIRLAPACGSATFDIDGLRLTFFVGYHPDELTQQPPTDGIF